MSTPLSAVYTAISNLSARDFLLFCERLRLEPTSELLDTIGPVIRSVTGKTAEHAPVHTEIYTMFIRPMNNKMIQTIKFVRDASNCGLKEAKDIVDSSNGGQKFVPFMRGISATWVDEIYRSKMNFIETYRGLNPNSDYKVPFEMYHRKDY